VRATPIRLELTQQDSDRLREILNEAGSGPDRRQGKRARSLLRAGLAITLVVVLILLVVAIAYGWLKFEPLRRIGLGAAIAGVGAFFGVEPGRR